MNKNISFKADQNDFIISINDTSAYPVTQRSLQDLHLSFLIRWRKPAGIFILSYILINYNQLLLGFKLFTNYLLLFFLKY